MNNPVFCDSLHNPCAADYVSDADCLREMADHFRDKAKAGWILLEKSRCSGTITNPMWGFWSRYHAAHYSALHLWARKSGEFDKPEYRALVRDRKRCEANWMAYCLNDLRIREGVRGWDSESGLIKTA